MRLSRKSKAPQPTTAVGLSLDDDRSLAAAVTASADDGRVLSLSADPAAPHSLVTSTLAGWTSHTHPVDLKLPRFSPPADTSRILIEKAEKGDAETKKLYGTQQASLVVYDFVRQPERGATFVTVAPAAEAAHSSAAARAALGERHRVRLEPQTHAVWRAARQAFLLESGNEQSDPAAHVVAVLVVKKSGYGAAVGTANLHAPGYAIEEPERAQKGGLSEQAAARAMLTEAVERLRDEMLSEATLGAIKVPPQTPATAFVACEPDLWPDFQLTMQRSADPAFRIEPLRLPWDANAAGDAPESDESSPAADPLLAAAYGAALAACAPTGPQSSPTVDLSETLSERLARQERERSLQAVADAQRRKTRAAAPLILAPLTALAVVIALFLGAASEASMLRAQDASEDARSAQLDAYIKRHDQQKKVFAHYQQESKEIFAKRSNQTRVAQLFLDLDRLWPVQDQSWTVTNLSSVKGSKDQIQIVGRTRQDAYFKAFAKSLEFEPGNTFSSVGPTIGLLSAGGAQAAASATAASNFGPSTQATGPLAGAYEWRLFANYNPTPQAQGAEPGQAQPQAATPAAAVPPQGGTQNQ